MTNDLTTPKGRIDNLIDGINEATDQNYSNLTDAINGILSNSSSGTSSIVWRPNTASATLTGIFQNVDEITLLPGITDTVAGISEPSTITGTIQARGVKHIIIDQPNRTSFSSCFASQELSTLPSGMSFLERITIVNPTNNVTAWANAFRYKTRLKVIDGEPLDFSGYSTPQTALNGVFGYSTDTESFQLNYLQSFRVKFASIKAKMFCGMPILLHSARPGESRFVDDDSLVSFVNGLNAYAGYNLSLGVFWRKPSLAPSSATASTYLANVLNEIIGTVKEKRFLSGSGEWVDYGDISDPSSANGSVLAQYQDYEFVPRTNGSTLSPSVNELGLGTFMTKFKHFSMLNSI